MMTLLCNGFVTANFGSIVGFVGGTIGIIAGLWALWDRYKNRIPRIKVFAPYQWTSIDPITKKNILAVFFRFSNVSQTPTYLFLETLKVEIYNTNLRMWEKAKSLKLMTEKIQTDFFEEKKCIYGITKAKCLDVFNENFVRFGEPLCGYLFFTVEDKNYCKLKGEVLDSRHKIIKFKIDFADQKKYDPNAR